MPVPDQESGGDEQRLEEKTRWNLLVIQVEAAVEQLEEMKKPKQ